MTFKGIVYFRATLAGFASLHNDQNSNVKSSERTNWWETKPNMKYAISCHGGYDQRPQSGLCAESLKHIIDIAQECWQVLMFVWSSKVIFHIGDANPSRQNTESHNRSSKQTRKAESNHTINLIKNVRSVKHKILPVLIKKIRLGITSVN